MQEDILSNKSQTGIGITDRSIASLASGSQLLMGQNLQRGALTIMNIGNANIGISFSALSADGSNVVSTAAIGTGGTYTIVPTGSYEPDGGFIPMGAIYVVGTAGQPVSAFESS